MIRLSFSIQSVQFAPACRRLCTALVGCLLSSNLLAVDARIGDAELQKQQQRQSALEQTLSAEQPDVRMEVPETVPGDIRFPEEKNCFPIQDARLQGIEQLPDQDSINTMLQQARGQCLGVKGIRLLMDSLQNTWLSQGYVTTRVLAPAQNLASGLLELTLVPGRADNIRFVGGTDIAGADSAPVKQNALPVNNEKLLNIRDIEQGLENLQRLPSVTADFQLVPGQTPGGSDVLINWQQTRNWRADFSVNDSGSDSTGVYQGSATLFWDNPLHLSDLFYLSVGHDLHLDSEKGTENYTLHYSVPYGYWELGTTLSSYDYLQTVAGLNQGIEYEGSSKTARFDLKRVVYRTNQSKTTLNTGLTLKRSNNFIEGQEVEVQERRTTHWTLGLHHRHYFPWGTLNTSVSYQKGLDSFGAIPAPESINTDIDSLADIFTTSIDLNMPFTLGNKQLRWCSRIKGQWSNDRLTATELFTIGNRYTVRGFDGDLTLSAERGIYWQNEIAWYIPRLQAELYAGIDYGAVSGPSAEFLAGKDLTGVVIGLSGNWKKINYRLFAGTPVSQPDSDFADEITAGFDLSWSL